MTGVDPSMFELFREEVRAHSATLSRGLVDVEANPASATHIEPLMRAAHSIKGASRIVGIDGAVRLAHVLEDALVAAQHGTIRLAPADIDLLLKGADILAGLAELTPTSIETWEVANAAAIGELEPRLESLAKGTPVPVRIAEPRPADATTLLSSGPLEEAHFPPVPAFEPAAISESPIPFAAEHSMLDLFREELRFHLREASGESPESRVDALRQIRGAARIVKCAPIERLALALHSYFSSGRKSGDTGGWLPFAVSTLAGAIATDDETFPAWLSSTSPRLVEIAEAFERASTRPTASAVAQPERAPVAENPPTATQPAVPAAPAPPAAEAVVRVTAESLNRLMGLAGESLVQARWLPSFSTSLATLKRLHDLLALQLDRAFHSASTGMPLDELGLLIAESRRQAAACRSDLSDKSSDFDDHAARAEDLNARLYREVIVSRMRPFQDGVHGYPRLVRDMSRTLGKDARLAIIGEQTEVDRDILEKLESPLSHLIRNAVDHGIEPAAVRTLAGKLATGTIRLEARHRAGMLQVTIADDGSGVDLEKLRKKIVDRGLSSSDVVARMTEAELLEFLFLPGFSTAAAVTEFSGRGVGLDVVQDTVRKIGGSVRITSQSGRGTSFHLQLPLTLSVIRAVLVSVAGEPYAFPHTRIDRLMRVRREDVRSIERRQFVPVDGQNVGLVVAAQLLDLPVAPAESDEMAVVFLSDASGSYGLVVDSFQGEQDLVVRPLDTRLGKVPNMSAAAILDDGSPVLIVDAEDLLRSMDQFIQTGSLALCETRMPGSFRKKRVLVVDDSITVREVERQLLLHKGYDVTVAVDGMDGWNKIRSESFDLLVSDIDMPRMTGLQLISAVRADPNIREIPVIIVSYKEREEDRLRGLEIGANSYLTKSSFHDNKFIEAVEDLIGHSG